MAHLVIVSKWEAISYCELNSSSSNMIIPHVHSFSEMLKKIQATSEFLLNFYFRIRFFSFVMFTLIFFVTSLYNWVRWEV